MVFTDFSPVWLCPVCYLKVSPRPWCFWWCEEEALQKPHEVDPWARGLGWPQNTDDCCLLLWCVCCWVPVMILLGSRKKAKWVAYWVCYLAVSLYNTCREYCVYKWVSTWKHTHSWTSGSSDMCVYVPTCTAVEEHTYHIIMNTEYVCVYTQISYEI
jgi:hypothetical protein